MRVPLSWLREHVDLPPSEDGRRVADRLVRAGLEVERVEVLGADLTGPVVTGRVLAYEQVPGTKKPIRWCRVDVGETEPRGVICGATNFAEGDTVVVALPGSVLPGNFAITARRTYGHVSDGMICSSRELGIGEDAAGILVLPQDTPVGVDAVGLLGLRDEVLDIAVTTDRGYCLSVRGVARETATAYALPFRDPADVPDLGAGEGDPHSVDIADPTACDRIVLRRVLGFDPTAASPLWLQQRLLRCGMRPISLAVDVTNYVLLELGQPLHAFDRAKLQGGIVVRRAEAGEKLETLDHVVRDLDPDDILITDASGPISLAGTMGGLQTEIDESSTDLVVEAAHFSPTGTARMSRRHRLSSEASRRFARGVDPELPPRAADRAARLLAELGGGTVGGRAQVDLGRPEVAVTMPLDLPARVAGYPYPPGEVVDLMHAVGARVTQDGDRLDVVPPTWRPDLIDPYDLVEEVARLHGYEAIPSVLPQAPAGRGLTPEQRLRRRMGRAMGAAGFVETPSYPFVRPDVWDALGLPDDDVRRRAARLANPLSDEEPELRTTLLPGLLAALRRNRARGSADLALFEAGAVFLPREDAPAPPRLGVDRRPTEEELAALDAVIPAQPLHVAAVLAGDRELSGWWGAGRPACWADAVEAAREIGRTLGLQLDVRRAERAPWHPGRCAEVRLGDRVVGHAGELHPRAVAALELPERTAAMELDLDPLLAAVPGPAPAPAVSAYPVATQDVALVVDSAVPAADVEAALVIGAGELLESVRLFDVYAGEQVGPGSKSLAYALRFRAPDRTLTAEEVGAAREAAVAEAARRTGAVLRSA